MDVQPIKLVENIGKEKPMPLNVHIIWCYKIDSVGQDIKISVITDHHKPTMKQVKYTFFTSEYVRADQGKVRDRRKLLKDKDSIITVTDICFVV